MIRRCRKLNPNAVVAACGQNPEAREVLLHIYANPVFNREKTEENENE